MLYEEPFSFVIYWQTKTVVFVYRTLVCSNIV